MNLKSKITNAFFVLIFVMLSINAFAITECKGSLEVDESPCIVLLPANTSSINCSEVTVSFYSNGTTQLYNQTMGEYNDFNCNATFNQTIPETYTFFYSTGDSGSIIVEVGNMMLSIVIGAGIIAFLLFFFAYKLENEHTILRLLLIFSAMTVLLLIPASILMPTTINNTFYRTFLYIFVAFWLYVAGYVIYWLLLKWGVIVIDKT